MPQANSTEPSKPWHRHPWTWFLIAIPAVSVVWGLSTLYIAIKYRDPLVTENAWEDAKKLEMRAPDSDAKRPAEP